MDAHDIEDANEAMRRRETDDGHIATVEQLHDEWAKLRRCLGFFASVIKSGESWTATCEREYRDARNMPAT